MKGGRSSFLVAVTLLLGALLLPGCGPSDVPPQKGETQQEVPKATMTIEEAKKAWEKKLMAIPGVTQVGIGLTKETKEICIQVSIDKERPEAREQIPEQIEGYPVEVRIRPAPKIQ
jgi:hypothetical protein